ncbi:hypothetical protein V8F06_011555 [Rhypophila decipiens]
MFKVMMVDRQTPTYIHIKQVNTTVVGCESGRSRSIRWVEIPERQPDVGIGLPWHWTPSVWLSGGMMIHDPYKRATDGNMFIDRGSLEKDLKRCKYSLVKPSIVPPTNVHGLLSRNYSISPGWWWLCPARYFGFECDWTSSLGAKIEVCVDSNIVVTKTAISAFAGHHSPFQHEGLLRTEIGVWVIKISVRVPRGSAPYRALSADTVPFLDKTAHLGLWAVDLGYGIYRTGISPRTEYALRYLVNPPCSPPEYVLLESRPNTLSSMRTSTVNQMRMSPGDEQYTMDLLTVSYSALYEMPLGDPDPMLKSAIDQIWQLWPGTE